MKFHQKGNEEAELPQASRDRFLFFFVLALITHLFVILNTAYQAKFPFNNPPMEIIFSETKTDQIDEEKDINTETSRTEKNQQKKVTAPKLVKKDNIYLNKPNIPLTKLKKPSAEQLIARSLAQASNHYDLIDSPYFKANKPRRKYITANNKDHRFASYMEAWRAKVERVGNINYPYEARKKNLSGKLLLDVAILQDGTVQQITIRRSSGKKILDRAAVRIVELAAPFAPLPESITREVDILHITRTWNFVNDSQFTTP